jgi:predicted enzyme related to lactoylglutathione lyase
MALARFKDLSMDATDPARLGKFWAEVLGRSWEPAGDGDGLLRGPTDRHTIWINRVPEPKTVKHRVHFDIYARRLADLEALGSVVLRPEGDDRRWTVMADPEGGEYDAFLRDDLPAERLYGLEVDCADPAAQAEWWGAVYGVPVVHNPRGYSTLENVPGLPAGAMDFDSVPEPKTVKNRIHWDVTVPAVQPLIDAGATVLTPPNEQARWYVLADPEGNEFCAFTDG